MKELIRTLILGILTAGLLGSCMLPIRRMPRPSESSSTPSTEAETSSEKPSDTEESSRAAPSTVETTLPPEESTETPTEPPADPDPDPAGSASFTIEPTVILDIEGIKVTATKIVEDEFWGPSVRLLIENDTEHDLAFSTRYLTINNYNISDSFDKTVLSGKKANEDIHIYESDLEMIGVDAIGEIAFSILVYDNDTWEDVLESDDIVLRTSLYDDISFEKPDGGVEFFDDEGVRIESLGIEEDSFWGNSLWLFIENNRSGDIALSIDDLSINGFMVTSYYGRTVKAGRWRIDDLYIYDSDLEDNDIEEIEEMEFTVELYDPYTYETYFESGVIRLTFP